MFQGVFPLCCLESESHIPQSFSEASACQDLNEIEELFTSAPQLEATSLHPIPVTLDPQADKDWKLDHAFKNQPEASKFLWSGMLFS